MRPQLLVGSRRHPPREATPESLDALQRRVDGGDHVRQRRDERPVPRVGHLRAEAEGVPLQVVGALHDVARARQRRHLLGDGSRRPVRGHPFEQVDRGRRRHDLTQSGALEALGQPVGSHDAEIVEPCAPGSVLEGQHDGRVRAGARTTASVREKDPRRDRGSPRRERDRPLLQGRAGVSAVAHGSERGAQLVDRCESGVRSPGGRLADDTLEPS